MLLCMREGRVGIGYMCMLHWLGKSLVFLYELFVLCETGHCLASVMINWNEGTQCFEFIWKHCGSANSLRLEEEKMWLYDTFFPESTVFSTSIQWHTKHGKHCNFAIEYCSTIYGPHQIFMPLFVGIEQCTHSASLMHFMWRSFENNSGPCFPK